MPFFRCCGRIEETPIQTINLPPEAVWNERVVALNIQNSPSLSSVSGKIPTPPAGPIPLIQDSTSLINEQNLIAVERDSAELAQINRIVEKPPIPADSLIPHIKGLKLFRPISDKKSNADGNEIDFELDRLNNQSSAADKHSSNSRSIYNGTPVTPLEKGKMESMSLVLRKACNSTLLENDVWKRILDLEKKISKKEKDWEDRNIQIGLETDLELVLNMPIDQKRIDGLEKDLKKIEGAIVRLSNEILILKGYCFDTETAGS